MPCIELMSCIEEVRVMSEANRDLPVLIAGGGPVGLSVAASLVTQGFRVEVFEKGEELADEARASTFHASSLEYFNEWGVADDVIAHGKKVHVLQFWERETKERVADFDYALIANDTPYPFRLQCPQNKVTRLILPKIEATGLAKVHFSHQAVSHRDLGDHVELDLKTPEGIKTVKGRYLIGADGSASAVRETLGMILDGETYEDRFLLVGTDLDYNPIFPEVGLVAYIYDPEEWVIIMHLPDVVRTVFRLKPDEDGEAALDEKAIRARMAKFIGREIDFTLKMRSYYRVHQRVAQTFRVGNVILAGDAAHINNPAGGMGMNSGIHDAHLLGKNLGEVLRGGSEALLDEYSETRKKAAVELVQASAAKNYKDLALTDPAARMQRNREMAAASKDPKTARAYLLRASMLEHRI
jgi:3-(3-hydroxy-phenyl)propionate hydroxylase